MVLLDDRKIMSQVYPVHLGTLDCSPRPLLCIMAVLLLEVVVAVEGLELQEQREALWE